MSLQRVKLFRVQANVDILKIYNKFVEYKYNDEDFGFYDTEFLEEGILFSSYTEKLEYNETTYDPYGNYLEEISYVNYKRVRFHIEKISNNVFLLALYDSPTGIKSFFDNVAKMFEYRIGFNPLFIDICKFMSVLKVNYGISTFGSGKLRVSRVTIDNNSKASIEISSIKDSFNALNILIGDKNYLIDKIISSFSLNGKVVNFELSKSGTVKVNEDDWKYLLEIIKTSMSD
ncbi:hypothetical protein AYY19_11675 [Photobacterium aquimaris]|uniref:Uncharacterized protein n=1 Tax=Photobacterium aquimaris TaxID=512643 RepID=A0A2T3IQH0_9GAMM|nr:hypothetical protein [Photobacterium aquimaris]OBU17034.1 hypothetical protein AYY20_05185 [Photobacterium aquimaris]OBU17801.1 hypothetical protein AYY19_11675 [Photobacterium aquimaris]PSU30597.1 hypothetical protein CTM88_03040 [Photobacterium aquimaris]PSW02484.1 hypothetical protein CTM91_05285 [Photobacterium aquimaris]